jgi:hypothetical protein
VLIADGPNLQAKEPMGGWWVLEAADLEEAVAWGRKAAIAGRGRSRSARFTELFGWRATQVVFGQPDPIASLVSVQFSA